MVEWFRESRVSDPVLGGRLGDARVAAHWIVLLPGFEKTLSVPELFTAFTEK
jgi:hypothetical protein